MAPRNSHMVHWLNGIKVLEYERQNQTISDDLWFKNIIIVEL